MKIIIKSQIFDSRNYINLDESHFGMMRRFGGVKSVGTIRRQWHRPVAEVIIIFLFIYFIPPPIITLLFVNVFLLFTIFKNLLQNILTFFFLGSQSISIKIPSLYDK